MLDWRTIVLGLGVFFATFAIGWWSGVGKLMVPVRASNAKATVQAASAAAETPAEMPAERLLVALPSAQGPGLTENAKLRDAVVLRAKAYLRPVCKQDAKTLYVVAATNYAQVLMRSAGCNNYPKCAMSEGQLDQVWQANRGPLDLPVASAMASAHAAGGLSDKSFRGDVARAVRIIAGTDFQPGPPPACVAQKSGASNARVRIRR